MNIYDFDGTIYNGDSTIDFFLYSLKHKPFLLIYLPKQIQGFILYKIKRIDKTKFKEYFFSYLNGLDVEKLIEPFWEENQYKIYEWYLKQQNLNDIIISASPEFLLIPICNKIGIKHLIASKVNAKTGKFYSKNCYGEEKVHRFLKEFDIADIEKFYSDSYSDLPLAKIAKESYFIKNGNIHKWNNN